MKMFTHENPEFKTGIKKPDKNSGGKQFIRSFILLVAFMFSASIVFGQALTITNALQSNPTGCSNNDGQILIFASGGTAPLEYSIDGGATYVSAGLTPNVFPGLSGGEYEVQVRDAIGTVEVWGANPLVLYNADGISIQGTNTTDASCFGVSDGDVQVVVDYGNSGDTEPFTFELFIGAASQGSNTTGIFTGLAAETYSVVVTNDACNETVAGLVVDQPDQIQLAPTVVDAGCNGAADGSITVVATDGIAPYTYVLKDNGGNIVTTNATGIFSGLAGGDYTVEVTDDNPCMVSTGVLSVANPASMSFDVVTPTGITCFGDNDGKIDVTVSGGTTPYTYYLNRGDASEQSNLTGNFTGLMSGDYDVSVEDANTCTATYNANPVTISEPTQLSIGSVNGTDVTGCNGDATGSIDISATGGTSPLSYSIDGGANWHIGVNTFNGLLADNYHVMVRDANMCSVDHGVVAIGEPTVVTISNVVGADVSCVNAGDGSVTVTAAGGTGILSYSVVPQGDAASYGASNVVTGLIEGIYDVQVKDAENCETAIQSVTLVQGDNTPPTALCNDFSVNLDAAGNASITVADVNNGSFDNCTITSMTIDKEDFTCANVGPNAVVLTVIDSRGLTSTCTSTVTVVDNIPPTPVCQNISIDLDATGNASIVAADIENGSTDNCAVASIAASQTAFTCADLGQNTVTLTVTDVNGNSATCDATVTVNDVTDPVANCVAGPVTVQLDASGMGSITAASLDNGSTDACGPLSFSASQTDFDCTDLGANVVTLTVEDGSGNSSTCDVTVNVEDNIPPTASCQPFTLELGPAGTATLLATDIDDGSSDNCTENFSLSQENFDCTDIGVQTVTLTVSDDDGNSDDCTAQVTVVDNVNPIAVCQDITIDLDATGNATITGADIDGGSSDNCGINVMTVSPNGFGCIDVGTNTVTLTVWDDNFNFSNCQATVTVRDVTPPVAACQPLTINLDANGFASIAASDLDDGSTDECALSFSASQTLFDCTDVGVNNVTLTVSDGTNDVDCATTVTVVDPFGPTAVCQDITVFLDNTGNATISAIEIDGGSDDNCSITRAASQTAFDCTHLGNNVVTLTVTDPAGATATCDANVLVVDNIDPVANCTNITVQLDPTGNVSITAMDVDNASTDNCGIVSYAISQEDFDCTHIGANTVTLTVTDASGNFATCNATVTVEDNVAPVLDAQAFTVSLDASGAVTVVGSDFDVASSDACGIDYFTIDGQASQTYGCGDVGTFQVAIEVFDVNGNSTSNNYDLTIEDNTNPTAVCMDFTAELDGTGSVEVFATDINNGSSDACGILSMNIDGNFSKTYGCANVGDHIVTFEVIDNNNNSSTCTATISVVDNMNPDAVCRPSIDIQLDANGNASITGAELDWASDDNCGIASLSASPSTFDCSNIGANTATLTVTDVNGNTSTCVTTVNVEDNVDPVLDAQDITVELDANGNVTVTGAEFDVASSDACGIDYFTIDGAASQDYDCTDVGTFAVTIEVFDVNNNSSSSLYNLTVEDVTAPVASCQDFTAQLDQNGSVTVLPSDIDNNSSDACGNLTYTINDLASVTYDCGDIGDHLVTLEVTDGSGLSSTCDATVTVEDNVAPNVSCKDITVELDAAGNASIIPDDVIQEIVTYTVDQAGVFNPEASPIAGTQVSLGDDATSLALPIGFAFEFYGNSFSEFYISSNGFISFSPNIDDGCCSGHLLPNGDSDFGNLIAFAWEDLDPGNGGQPAKNLVQYTTLGAAPNRKLVVEFYEVDHWSSGNNVTTQLHLYETSNLIEIHTINMPSDGGNHTMGVQNMDGTIATTVPGRNSQDWSAVNDYVAFIATPPVPDISDNCGIATTEIDVSDFTCANVGDNPVVVTVTDVNNNTSSCTATVTVVDAIAPSASCQDLTIQLDASGNASITPAQVNDGSTDNCGIIDYSLDVTDFTCADLGPNMVTLTVTDDAGNSDNCTATITVEDNVAPNAICQDITVSLVANSVTVNAMDIDNGSSDACGIVTYLIDGAASIDFDCADVATSPHTVTLTVIDGTGNSATCTADITVIDNTPPVALCAPFTAALGADGTVTVVAADIDGGSSDDCGNITMSVSPNTFTCDDIATSPHTVTLTVTDDSGNTSTCDADVNVVDNMGPDAQCVLNPIIELDATGNKFITAADIDDSSTDNCGIASMTVAPFLFTCADVGPVVVTLTVTDIHGNVSTCTSNATVVDNTAPVISCNPTPNDISLDATGNAVIDINDIVASSFDACGIATTEASPNTFDCNDVGPNTITLTVTDVNGNVSTCQTSVNIVDDQDPTAICKDIFIQLDANGAASIVADDINNGSSDNCSFTLSASQTDFDCTHIGPNTVTLTVTDASNNTATCDATVTVVDNMAPSAICQDITVELDATGNASITANDVDGGSTDNCNIASMTVAPNTFTCADAGTVVAVTLTVTDDDANVATCTANVTVEDNILPIVTCPADDEIFIGAGCEVLLADYSAQLTATDACGIASAVQSPAAGTAYSEADAGPQTVTFTVTDNNGNVETCSFTVTVSNPEVFTIDDVQYTDITCNGETDGTITVLTTGAPSGLFYSIDGVDYTNTTGLFTGVGAGTYTVTAKNINDCMVTYSPDITITEPAALMFNIVLFQAPNCNGDANGELIIMAMGGHGNLEYSIDGGATWGTDSHITGLTAGFYEIYIRDADFPTCDLYYGAPYEITEPPALQIDGQAISNVTCFGGNDGDITINASGGSGDLYFYLGAVGFTPDFNVLPPANNNFFDNLTNGDYDVYVTDDHSCVLGPVTYTIGVDDVNPPTVVTQDISVSLDANGNVSITAAQVDNGSFDDCSIVSMSVAPNSFTCAELGPNNVTLSVEDSNGNIATGNAVVTVVDDMAPTFTAPIDMTIYSDAACAYDASVAVTGDVTDEADNCSVGEATYMDAVDNTNPCSIVITRTWSLVDDEGNAAADQVQVITVEDNTAPTFTAPADMTIFSDATCMYDASIAITGDVTDEADNCGVGEATYMDVVDNTDPCAITITRTWSLVDNCGNAAADQVQVITVEDNIAPTFTAPADMTIYSDATCMYDASVAVTGDVIDEADNCGVGEATYMDVVDNADPCAITITRTWSLVDNCGNAAVDQVQMITVEDNIAPTFTAPADITIYSDATCMYDASVAFTGDVTDEADNCGVGEATYMDVVDNADPCAITITRTWSLVDNCGNAAADQVQVITVEDNIAPTFTAPADMTIFSDATCMYDASVAVTGDVIDEADNCGVGEATYMDVVDNADPCAITITRTWSLVDNCGNAAVDQVQVITVEDNIAPTFTAPADITIYSDATCMYDASVAFTGDVTDEADNCGVGEATYMDVVDNADPCAITITRTWSLVDNCGNAAADQVQVITVEDNTAPTFTAPADMTIFSDATCMYDASIAITGDVTDEADNCGVGEATYMDVVDNTDPCAITITRTWSLVDNCGNAAADQVQVITVEDNIAPTFTAPADITIYKDAACAYDADPAFAGDVTDEADNCGVGEATYMDVVDNTDPCIVTITRTWSLVDNCGNAAADQIQVITVEDNTDPIAVCQDISIDLDANGMVSIVAADIDGGSSDNCGFTLSASQLDFDCSHVGPNTVTLTVTDDCGNTATCDAIVTVNDITAPVITCPADQDLFIGAGCEVTLPDYTGLVVADDACGIASITQDPVAGVVYTGADAGAYTVEFTVTDVNNNVSTCSITVNVSDQEVFTIDDVQFTDVLCNGANDGTITVITTGAPSGLFYSIDGVDYTNTTGVFTGLAPGTYTVSAMNINDCMVTFSPDITISEPTPLVIDDVITSNVTGCAGNTNATIEILASGGTPVIEYSIDNQVTWSTSNFFDNLAAGAYDIFVMDANGCVTPWGTTINVNEPAPVLLVDVDIVHITGCYGDLAGEIHVEAAGGTGTLSYSIDGGATFFENDGMFTGLAAGFYNLVIVDENGCDYVAPSPIVITQPNQLVVNDVMVTDVTECYGNTDGALDVSAIGGTGTILYSIDGGTTFVDNGGLFENLAGGDYNVFITDDNGCIGEYAMNPVTIAQPVQITMTVTSGDVNGCAGNVDGFISIVAAGGTEVFTYSIDGGTTWSSSADFTGLAAGSYEVWTQDDLGCMQPYSGNPVVIDEPVAISYDEIVIANLDCHGAANGEILVVGSGGTGLLMYSIDGGATYQTNGNFTGLNAGEYNLVIMDENACEVAYENNPVLVAQPDEIIVSDVEVNNESCSGSLGSIVVTASGGDNDLMYSIDDGNTYQASNSFQQLQADTYIVKVKDGTGCEQYYPGNPVVVQDLNPSSIVINANPGTEVCAGTDVELSANAYEAVSYTWSNGETGPEITVNEATPGIYDYTCTVVNMDGCESTETISINFDAGSEITITVDPEQGPYCVDDAVVLEAYAEDALSYEWQPGGFADPIIEVTSDTEQSIEYTVTVINTAGCETTESVVIDYEICTGLAELESDIMSINVYPNPNSGEFSLELIGINQEVEISVIDFAGRLILEEKILDITADKMEKQFDLTDYERGVYFLRITHGGKVSYKKVVVQ